MKNNFIGIIVALIILFSASGFGQNNIARAQEDNTPKIRVVYFYAVDCPKCQKIKSFIEEIKKEYGYRIEFLEHDVKKEEYCRQLFYNFVESYHVSDEKAGTPLIFVGKDYLAGVDDIKNNLRAKIDRAAKDRESLLFDCHKFDQEWPNVRKIDFAGASGSEVCSIETVCSINNENSSKKISLTLIIATAAIDSINPCAIAVLIFLLTVLVSLKASKMKMLKIGMIYISGVFITYYLAGLGLMRIITQFDIAAQIGIVAGAIALLAGILEIKEGLYPDRKQLLVIPEKSKSFFTGFIKKATVPSVFVAGVLVSAFELPCTGQVYLGILSMLSQENMKAQGYAYLFIYNFIFVLPLIVILFIGAWGFDIGRMEHMRKKTRMAVKILMGIMMVVLGIFLLFQDKVLATMGMS